MKQRVVPLAVALLCAWHVPCARADSPNLFSPTPNLWGSIGLNTVPSARMDTAGTLRAGVSAADPYVHTYLGFQPTDHFYFGLRQTSEISNLREGPDKVFPGVDFKLKLFDEKLYRPEISLGLQSAFGQKRMAAEYLAFSKRYHDFDFTAGIGWGRFGSRNSARNPFDWTGSYLSDHRSLDGDKPNGPKDWFTGDTGFFAGIEYATPFQGLSLKADFSSDDYKAERALGQDGPSPYSLGLTYKPVPWADIGVAWMDHDTVMARLNLSTSFSKWPFRPSAENPVLLDLGPAPRSDIVSSGKNFGLYIKDIQTNAYGASARLRLNDNQTSPFQLGQAWRLISNGTESSENGVIRLEPSYFGLKAPAISINRRDLALAETGRGSPEEIWRNTDFDDHFSPKWNTLRRYIPRFTLRENFSLSEDDSPFLHRTDLVGTLGEQIFGNVLIENSLRYNISNNIGHIEETRLVPDNAVRSDIYRYLVKPLAIERAFVQGFKSFTTDWHITASAGYLEEMFAGYHGEILYRPWGKNWALGVEAANVIKRDYDTPLNMGYLGRSVIVGQANAYYEIPDSDMTLHASFGRYLAEDTGGTLEFKNTFRNGATLGAFLTATNMSDPDPYGATASLSSGIRFTLPLGSLTYIPEGSGIEVNAAPIGRDTGQQLDIAHHLYDMTEPLSYRHITRNWGDVVTQKNTP